MHQAKGVTPDRGPIVSKGAPFAIALGPQSAPGAPAGMVGPGWDPNASKERIWLQETSYASKEICYDDSTEARKMSSVGEGEGGGSLSLADALAPVAFPWIRPFMYM